MAQHKPTKYIALVLIIMLSAFIHSMGALRFWIYPSGSIFAIRYIIYFFEIIVAPIFIYRLSIIEINHRKNQSSNRSASNDILFVAYAVTALITLPISVLKAHDVRAASLKHFAQQSNEVIDAVEAYKSDMGSYPNELKELVPTYLPNIPNEFMQTATFYYIEKTDTSWSLRLTAQIGDFDDAIFVYPPSNPAKSGAYGKWELLGIG